MSMTSPSAHSIPPPPYNCPLRIGTRDEFTCVRKFLTRIAFTESRLCRALQIRQISDLPRVDWDSAPLDELSTALRLFLNVFVRIQSRPEGEFATTWGSATVDAFRSLGLLQRSKLDPGRLMSTVWLSPIAGFVVASDLTRDADDADDETPRYLEDAVFPAIASLTKEFLHFLPDGRGGEALDLCGGSGIGALHLARTARLSASADITQRSAFYAAFNGMLNDVPIVSYCGDLYEPVAGRQFDLVCAHPPYVPDIGPRAIYRDGGEVGETITRRIIEQLPRHLRSDGTCVIVGYQRDTHAQPFEQRVRDWLGDAGAEFDIIFAVDRNQSIEQVTEGQRSRLRGDDVNEQLLCLAKRLRDLDTRRFSHGVLLLRRKSSPVTSQPLRLGIRPEASPAEFDRIFAWRDRRLQPDFKTWLVEQRPRLASHLELRTRQVVKDGQLVDADIMFHVEHDVEASLRMDRWIVSVLIQLDGKQSIGELFEASQRAGAFPDGFPLDVFSSLIDAMIERGYLELAPAA